MDAAPWIKKFQYPATAYDLENKILRNQRAFPGYELQSCLILPGVLNGFVVCAIRRELWLVDVVFLPFDVTVLNHSCI